MNSLNKIENSVRVSLKNLGVSYLDLYWMHWPESSAFGDATDPPTKSGSEYRQFLNRFKTTWKAMEGEIQAIASGLACGGSSRSAQQAELRKIRRGSDRAVAMVDRPYKQPNQWAEPVTFTATDCTGVCYLHDDPLIISALLSNYEVRRVLIDNDSSSDIIFLNAYRQLKIGKEKLSLLQTPLVGFTGN
ncbi:uncharacterized protein LOC114315313 [Camellia sinensis]|uniref:uncharacterized protein LOC114315313 n=1 Tax=Camellia sinensis TaxID=4442 RepID=UPI001035D2C7|nr:uncharacterized protein LOC114315313 [Camellia sinensis]